MSCSLLNLIKHMALSRDFTVYRIPYIGVKFRIFAIELFFVIFLLRYFTCDPGYGLFSQANKIQMVDSPVTSSSSLASYDTPKRPTKANTEEVMKPDFVNRTPVPTPGVKSSLSGMLGKVEFVILLTLDGHDN